MYQKIFYFFLVIYGMHSKLNGFTYSLESISSKALLYAMHSNRGQNTQTHILSKITEISRAGNKYRKKNKASVEKRGYLN